MRRRDVLLSALGAVNTANALRPFDRHTVASVPAFAAAWPTSDFPLAVLAGHLAGTVRGARRGDFQGRSGVVNLSLRAATAAGLASLEWDARRSGRVYEEALTAALGADYRERILHPMFPGSGVTMTRRPGPVRMLRVRQRFARDNDLSYGVAGKENLLDIWRRADLPSNADAPVLIQIPGGQWSMGSKQGQAYPLMSHLAERGWICVAISYRLSPQSPWPAHVVDVKRAIAWVRSNIARYGGDPGFIAVTGGSAGGHLSTLAALTAEDKDWQPGFEGEDTSVQAAVPFYGAYDFTNRDRLGHRGLVPHLERTVLQSRLADDFARFDAASPMSRVNADAPPFLVSHGRNDALIPVEQARSFVSRLRAVARQPVVYAELPSAQHAFDVFGTVRAARAAEAVERFLGVAYGEYSRRH